MVIRGNFRIQGFYYFLFDQTESVIYVMRHVYQGLQELSALARPARKNTQHIDSEYHML